MGPLHVADETVKAEAGTKDDRIESAGFQLHAAPPMKMR
jgi:hypothetical protein